MKKKKEEKSCQQYMEFLGLRIGNGNVTTSH